MCLAQPDFNVIIQQIIASIFQVRITLFLWLEIKAERKRNVGDLSTVTSCWLIRMVVILHIKLNRVF